MSQCMVPDRKLTLNLGIFQFCDRNCAEKWMFLKNSYSKNNNKIKKGPLKNNPPKSTIQAISENENK